MLKLMKKSELWDSIDQGFVPKNPITYHLKYAQDVMAFKEIGRPQGLRIGEIGADHSRVLPDLTDLGNDCYAIDIYSEAIGGGKTRKPEDTKYKFFDCLLGSGSRGLIPDNFFDVTFSISVVEHLQDFDAFFDENVRITKPGGKIIHMVDIYLNDDGIAFQSTLAEKCLSFVERTDVVPIGKRLLQSTDFKFSTSLATNGDDMMYRWNKQVPSLKGIRETSAVCCIMIGVTVKN